MPSSTPTPHIVLEDPDPAPEAQPTAQPSAVPQKDCSAERLNVAKWQSTVKEAESNLLHAQSFFDIAKSWEARAQADVAVKQAALTKAVAEYNTAQSSWYEKNLITRANPSMENQAALAAAKALMEIKLANMNNAKGELNTSEAVLTARQETSKEREAQFTQCQELLNQARIVLARALETLRQCEQQTLAA